MLEFIRRFSHSIGAKVLFSLIAFVFILWGMGGVISRFGEPDYLVKIGNRKVTASEFSNAYRRYKVQLQEQLGPIGDERAQELRLPDRVLSTFIQRNLATLALQETDLLVGEEVIKVVLRTEPRFQNEDKQFSKDKLRTIVAASKLPEAAFLEALQHETESKLFTLPFMVSAPLPELYASALSAALAEKREISCVRISLKEVPAPSPPSEEMLKQFYTEHQERFMVPEKRQFTLASIDKAAVEKTIVLNPEDVQHAYDRYVERTVDDPHVKSLKEIRPELEKELRQEVLPDRISEVVRQIEDALAGGKSLEDIIGKFPITTKVTGEVSREAKALPANGSSMYAKESRALLKAIFEADEGSNGTFQEMADGSWVFVRVSNVKAEHVASFDDARAKVLTIWTSVEKEKSLATQVQNILKTLKNGVSLKAQAAQHRWAYHVLPPFSLRDLAQGGAPKVSGVSQEFLINLLKFPVGQGSSALNGEGAIVAAVTRILPHAETGTAVDSSMVALLRHQMAVSLMQQALFHSERQHKVKVNEKAFKALGVVEPIQMDDDY